MLPNSSNEDSINSNNTTDQTIDDFYTFYYYFYVHPVVTWLAVASNAVSAVVFAQRELLSSGPFFQYSLVNSVGAAIGMAILSGFCLTRCGPLCSQGYSYAAETYELYGVALFGNSLYFSSSLIQIAISFQLYLSISQRFKRLNSLSPAKVMFVFILIGLSFGIVVLFSFQIAPANYKWNGTIHSRLSFVILLDPSKPILVYLSLFVQIVCNKLFLIVLIFINWLLYKELRKILNNKSALTNSYTNVHELSRVISNRLGSPVDRSMVAVETILSQAYDAPKQKYSGSNEASRKKTLVMVLWVSVVFSSSRLVFALANLVLLFMQNSVYNWWASSFNLFYSACVYFSYFFVYFKTNKLFRKMFLRIFFRRDVSTSLKPGL